MLKDFTWWTYLILLMASLFGMVVYIYNCIRLRHVRYLDVYVMIYQISLAIFSGVAIYARSVRFIDPHSYAHILQNPFWPLRLWPLIIVVIAFVSHRAYAILKYDFGDSTMVEKMTAEVNGIHDKRKNKERRKDDSYV